MTITSDCIKLLKHYEGLAKVGDDGMIYPYEDVAGYATIGYGNRFYLDGTDVSLTDGSITKIEALMMLTKTAEDKAKKVKRLVEIDICAHQLDALTSFAYNLGVGALGGSTLLKKINGNAKRKEIMHEFMRWVYAGGKKLPGLVRRRNSEAILYGYGELDVLI